MSANTPLINNAVEKLQHIEKSATAKAVKAIPLGFKALKRGQALLMTLLCILLSIVIVGQNQVLNEVRAWKKEAKSQNVMLSNWVTAREKKMQDTMAENARLQKEMNAKRFKWGRDIEAKFECLQNDLMEMHAADHFVIQSTAKDLFTRVTDLEMNSVCMSGSNPPVTPKTQFIK